MSNEFGSFAIRKFVIRHLLSSPTRIRTWNTSVEARDDDPFHHRAMRDIRTAEGMGFEPTRRLRRRTV
jgi:hypothetical protein